MQIFFDVEIEEFWNKSQKLKKNLVCHVLFGNTLELNTLLIGVTFRLSYWNSIFEKQHLQNGT